MPAFTNLFMAAVQLSAVLFGHLSQLRLPVEPFLVSMRLLVLERRQKCLTIGQILKLVGFGSMLS